MAFAISACVEQRRGNGVVFFFNEFSAREFTRDNFVTALKNYIDMQDDATEIATRSLEEDFNCIVGTYLPRHKSDDKKFSAKVFRRRTP